MGAAGRSVWHSKDNGDAVLLVVLAVIVAMAACGLLMRSAKVHTKDPSLTYGSVFDVVPRGKHIDLVQVLATNGLVGYVYRDDEQAAAERHAAIGADPSLVYLPLRGAKPVEALRAALSYHAGRNVSFEEAQIVLDCYYGALQQNGMPSAEYASEPNDTLVISGVSFDKWMIERSLVMASRAGTTYIPVYAEDGKTVIGQFSVGSLL